MEKETKKNIAVLTGDCSEVNYDAIFKALLEQKIIEQIHLTVYPGKEDGWEKLLQDMQSKHIDGVLIMPLEGVNILEQWRALTASDEDVCVHLLGELKYIHLLDSYYQDAENGQRQCAQKMMAFSEILKKAFRLPLPRLAVMSTSTTSDGKLTRADQSILAPALQRVFDEKVPIFGPFSAAPFMDTENFRRFDGLVFSSQMQKDQLTHYFDGLEQIMNFSGPCPLMLCTDVPEQREAIFREAIYQLADVIQHLTEYKEISVKPLKFELKRENNEFQAF